MGIVHRFLAVDRVPAFQASVVPSISFHGLCRFLVEMKKKRIFDSDGTKRYLTGFYCVRPFFSYFRGMKWPVRSRFRSI